MKKANSPQSSPLRKGGSFDSSEIDDYDIASEQVEQILGNTQPKNFGEGLTSGVGYMLRGAIGAVGAVVVSSTFLDFPLSTPFCILCQYSHSTSFLNPFVLRIIYFWNFKLVLLFHLADHQHSSCQLWRAPKAEKKPEWLGA